MKSAVVIDKDFYLDEKYADVILTHSGVVEDGLEKCFEITEDWTMWFKLSNGLILAVDFLPYNSERLVIATLTYKEAKKRFKEMITEEGWEVVKNELF